MKINRKNKQMSKAIKKIAILFAMGTEAKQTINAFNMTEIKNFFDPRLKLKCYKTTIKQDEIFLIVNDIYKGIYRVGTQAAALMAWETIKLIKPDIIISAGTAGGFSETGACIGTVYLSTNKIYYYDRNIPLGDYEKYGRGEYKSLEAPFAAKKFGIKLGIIASGNSLTTNVNDFIELKKLGVNAKEMEGAAIAEVASLCGIKFIAIKSITNIIKQDADAPGEFEKNFKFAVDALTEKLVKFAKFILGKKPEELIKNSVV